MTLLLLAASWAAAAPAAFPDFRTDPRIELLSVVQLLSGAESNSAGFHANDCRYLQDIRSRFARFATHPVVERYRALTRGGLDYVTAYQLMLELSGPPSLEAAGELPGDLVDRAGGKLSFEEFRLLLADFARTTGFQAFYAGESPFLSRMVEGAARDAGRSGAGRLYEAYTGLPVRSRFTFLLSPFAESVGAAAVVRRDEDGVARVLCVLGPYEVREGVPRFLVEHRAADVWRETAALQLEEFAGKYRPRLRGSEVLFQPIAGACYGSWSACAQRQIAFAVAGRLYRLHVSQALADEWPVKYRRLGLPYLGPLMERLKEYEADRARYPTLEAFYPRLLDVFDELARRPPPPPPFTGDLRDLLAERGPVTVILPTGTAGLEAARAEAARSAKGRWPQASVVSDSDAFDADLSSRTLVVIGTPLQNRWLARHKPELPVRLEDGRVSVSREGEPEDSFASPALRVLSIGLNPFDASRGMLLGMATEPEGLVGILDSYSGPAHFVILARADLLKVGLYERTRLPWRVK